ncbi:MAG: hypothetical protein HFI75_06405 [Lachnospiraceae bacterium]|nr:hypothetical protein [Lachnospiraceae bacterium]
MNNRGERKMAGPAEKEPSQINFGKYLKLREGEGNYDITGTAKEDNKKNELLQNYYAEMERRQGIEDEAFGILHPGWSDIVILTEPDTEKARQIFSGWIDQTLAMKEKEIENKQKEIAELEKKLEVVQSFKDPWQE